MAKFLLEHGADVRMMDTFSTTPLHYAAELCSQSIIKLLLNHGAPVSVLVNVRDDHFCSPLHEAASQGDLTTAELLLKHGALYNVQDSSQSLVQGCRKM
jgi:ankyrin repeat protein